MKVLIFLFALLSVVLSTTFTMSASVAVPTVDSVYNRLDWIKKSDPTFIIGTEGDDTFIVKIRHTLLDSTKFTNLEGEVQSKNSLGIYVNPPSVAFVNEGGFSMVNIRYKASQITNGDVYGCVSSGSIGNYNKYSCVSQINYWGTESRRMLRMINYGFTVMVNTKVQNDFVTSAQEELVNGCNCTLVQDVPATLNLLKEDCTTAVEGNILTFGQTYCLRMAAQNNLGKQYFFKTTQLLMTYKGNDGSDAGLDILSRATVMFGATGSEKGIAQAKFMLAAVSTPLKFKQTVVLQNTIAGRLLQSASSEVKGIQLASLEYTVPIQVPIKVPNSGASLTISMVLLIALTFLLL